MQFKIQQNNKAQRYKKLGKVKSRTSNVRKNGKNFVEQQYYCTFAPLFISKILGLSHCVMVAQQILVLLVRVRILVRQQIMLIYNQLLLQRTKIGTNFILAICF